MENGKSNVRFLIVEIYSPAGRSTSHKSKTSLTRRNSEPIGRHREDSQQQSTRDKAHDRPVMFLILTVTRNERETKRRDDSTQSKRLTIAARWQGGRK